jgi:NAD(P)-dependent dehydrogenase (short-subunit alcohol dehydrogenase family)
VARGTGTVINITHVLDPSAGANVSAYQASRAAVSALTRKLASELPSPMTAVELDPGELLGLRSETEVRSQCAPQLKTPRIRSTSRPKTRHLQTEKVTCHARCAQKKRQPRR